MLGLLANELSVYVRENLSLSIVMNENVKDVDAQKLQKMLDASPFVKSTEYIDKNRAIKELSDELGEDPATFLGYNPLLASLEIKLHSEYANNDSIAKIDANLRKMPQVKEVIYQKNLIQAVNDNVSRITAFLLGVSVLLLLISIALISNTVRLNHTILNDIDNYYHIAILQSRQDRIDDKHRQPFDSSKLQPNLSLFPILPYQRYTTILSNYSC